MSAIKISVNRLLDGYSFSITPTIRNLIKGLIPNAHPASNIFVGYDTKSDFESHIGTLEHYIYPVLLGIVKNDDLSKLDEIHFVDSQSGKVMHTLKPSDQEV